MLKNIMELTSRLIRPLIRNKESLIGKVNGFVDPIKKAVADLRGRMPSPKGFAGSEDLAEGEPVSENGLIVRLKKFKKSLKGMSDFQKLILLTIAIVLPAGILLSALLVGFIKSRKK